jgi:hypothetical protein
MSDYIKNVFAAFTLAMKGPDACRADALARILDLMPEDRFITIRKMTNILGVKVELDVGTDVCVNFADKFMADLHEDGRTATAVALSESIITMLLHLEEKKKP